jgi:hypothetical protein
MKGNSHSPWNIPVNRAIIAHHGMDGTALRGFIYGIPGKSQRLVYAGFERIKQSYESPLQPGCIRALN